MTRYEESDLEAGASDVEEDEEDDDEEQGSEAEAEDAVTGT